MKVKRKYKKLIKEGKLVLAHPDTPNLRSIYNIAGTSFDFDVIMEWFFLTTANGCDRCYYMDELPKYKTDETKRKQVEYIKKIFSIRGN